MFASLNLSQFLRTFEVLVIENQTKKVGTLRLYY